MGNNEKTLKVARGGKKINKEIKVGIIAASF